MSFVGRRFRPLRSRVDYERVARPISDFLPGEEAEFRGNIMSLSRDLRTLQEFLREMREADKAGLVDARDYARVDRMARAFKSIRDVVMSR